MPLQLRVHTTPRPLLAVALAALASGCGDPAPQPLVRVIVEGLATTPAREFNRATVEVAVYFHRATPIDAGGPRTLDTGARWDQDLEERRVIWWVPGQEPFEFQVMLPEGRYDGARVEARVQQLCSTGSLWNRVAVGQTTSPLAPNFRAPEQVRIPVTGVDLTCP